MIAKRTRKRTILIPHKATREAESRCIIIERNKKMVLIIEKKRIWSKNKDTFVVL